MTTFLFLVRGTEQQNNSIKLFQIFKIYRSIDVDVFNTLVTCIDE